MSLELEDRGAPLEVQDGEELQCRVDLDTGKHTETEFPSQTKVLEDCEDHFHRWRCNLWRCSDLTKLRDILHFTGTASHR